MCFMPNVLLFGQVSSTLGYQLQNTVGSTLDVLTCKVKRRKLLLIIRPKYAPASLKAHSPSRQNRVDL